MYAFKSRGFLSSKAYVATKTRKITTKDFQKEGGEGEEEKREIGGGGGGGDLKRKKKIKKKKIFNLSFVSFFSIQISNFFSQFLFAIVHALSLSSLFYSLLVSFPPIPFFHRCVLSICFPSVSIIIFPALEMLDIKQFCTVAYFFPFFYVILCILYFFRLFFIIIFVPLPSAVYCYLSFLLLSFFFSFAF